MAMRLLLSLCLMAAFAMGQTPIVFVHGNGDDAAKWIGIIALFESNGYPAERLRAIRFANPSSRSDDAKPEVNRSSATDQAAELAAFVTRTLMETGSKQVVLVGSSRGGNAIRNYVKFGGGAANVSHAILCGTPNHGVFQNDAMRGNEFNGKGLILSRLNEGGEVVPGIRWMTIRSDKADKYAQPSGSGYLSPALEGAENVVIENADHREVAFDPRAFRLMYRFVTGNEAKLDWPVAQEAPVVSGLVTGFANNAATNLPEAGVRLQVWKLDAETAARAGAAVLDVVTKADGAWGPLTVDPKAFYEFELSKDGKAVRYFKSPLMRSTAMLNLRWVPVPVKPGQLVISRPQGYFSKGRDKVLLDGVESADVPAGLPNLDRFVVTLAAGKTGVKVDLRQESIRARPSEENVAAVADLLWE